MKKSIKKILLLMAVVMTAMVCFAFSASAETKGYYTYEVENGGATITDVRTSISGDVTIPSTLGGYSVTSIGSDAFEDCTGLTSITIPDSVTSIGYSAFEDCTGLTSITIPDSVTSIGTYAFCGCTGLTSIVIPDSVTSIGYYAFSGCTSLENITIPDSVKSISSYAFEDCTSLESVTIGKGIKEIPNYAFRNCTSLTSIVIPDSVTSIGSYAFEDCTGLTSITIPDSVTSIGSSAFYKCSGLTSITIPDSVTSIDSYAFYYCTGLTSIIIPDSVTSIRYSVFDGCRNLKNVNYTGSEENWEEIIIYGNNEFLENATISYYYGCVHEKTVVLKAVSATCTKTGLTEGKKCAYCETVIVKQKTVNKKSHTYKTTTTKATLSENGKVVSKCTVGGHSKTTTIYYPKTFKLSATSYSYNGKAKTPTVTVKDSKGNTLKNGTDYTVSYSSNKAIGTAKAKITFKGAYSGSKTLSFKIVLGATDKIKATQTATTVKLSWNKVAGAKGYKVYVYDKKGELQLARTTTKTSMTVDDLSKATQYMFVVKAYTTVSKKTVWSEKTKSITTATLPGAPTLSVAAGSKKASLSWTKQSGANGYVVYMATSKKGKYSKIGTLEGVANLKMTKSKLTKGKTYYFKVRAYKTVNGTKLYGAWSSVKSVKIK